MKVCKDCIHIDACAFWKNSEIDCCTYDATKKEMEKSEACEFFKAEFIKCKECKYFRQDIGGGERPGFCTNPHSAVVVQSENVTRWNCAGVTPNDFCSFAEREAKNGCEDS